MPGVYLVDEEGNPISAANPLDVTAAFTGGDIEIGAVELKDATTAARAVIDATYGLSVDVKRSVLPTGAATETTTAALLAKIPAVGAAAKAAAVPVTMATDQPPIAVSRTEVAPVGTHANAWNNVAVAINGTSNSLDMQYCVLLAMLGNASVATTLTLQYSHDNVNFYDSALTIAANGNFATSASVGCRYVRMKSSAAATITLTLAAKD